MNNYRRKPRRRKRFTFYQQIKCGAVSHISSGFRFNPLSLSFSPKLLLSDCSRLAGTGTHHDRWVDSNSVGGFGSFHFKVTGSA